MNREDIEKLLDRAYLETAKKIEAGLKVHPANFDPCWETIKEGRKFIEKHPELTEALGMYELCIAASKEYELYNVIGCDSAFSSVIDQIGIDHKSADWYRTMSYHYEKRANQIDAEKDPA